MRSVRTGKKEEGLTKKEKKNEIPGEIRTSDWLTGGL